MSHWFGPQLANYAELIADGLIDVALDGTQPIGELARELIQLTEG